MHSEKILITGGHLTPAVAVVDELQKRGYTNIVWVGHKFTMLGDTEPGYEYKTITARNIPFHNLETGKLYRHLSLVGIRSLFRIPKGFFQALEIIKNERPKLIISFGGYLAVPVVVAARLYGIDVVTHEQTVVVGLANKIIARFAKEIYITWPESKQYFPPEKTTVTGNPVRQSIFTNKSSLFPFPNNNPILLIMGGNQGSHTINQIIKSTLPALLEKYNIIHQCGSNTVVSDFDLLEKEKNTLPERLQTSYLLEKQITEDEIGTAFHKASLFIGRSGANTTYELLALQKFSILIPLPYATHDEQLKNARVLQKIGLAKIIEQKDLTEKKLLQIIDDSIIMINKYQTSDPLALRKIQEKARDLYIPDAAKRITDTLEALLGNG